MDWLRKLFAERFEKQVRNRPCDPVRPIRPDAGLMPVIQERALMIEDKIEDSPCFVMAEVAPAGEYGIAQAQTFKAHSRALVRAALANPRVQKTSKRRRYHEAFIWLGELPTEEITEAQYNAALTEAIKSLEPLKKKRAGAVKKVLQTLNEKKVF